MTACPTTRTTVPIRPNPDQEDRDADGEGDACDPDPATLTLNPPAATNEVGTEHTVTATVENAAGGPVEGTTVRFTVSGSRNATGSCTTGADGTCSFTYTGPDFPGADAIDAYADTNDDADRDAGEPTAEATKAWVLPATGPGHVTGGGQVGAKVAFGFNVKGDETGAKGTCNVVDQALETHVKCLTVEAIIRTGNHARFYGTATVNGQEQRYRIDVDDNGEPGRTDTFTITTSGGYTVGGTITKGNVQIH